MAFKTFAPGVLTSSDVNTFLMRQAVITCTSSTRPASPSEGMTIYETDTNLYLTYTGSSWVETAQFIAPDYQSYTPTWTNLTVGNSPFNEGYYTVIGKTAHVRVRLIFGSTTAVTGGTNDNVGCSFPPGFSFGGDQAGAQMGLCRLIDDSVGTGYRGGVNIIPGLLKIVSFNASSTTLKAGPVTSTVPHTWAVDDEIRFSITYGIG